ncbi:MAG: porin family protein [Prevotella sp.]|nr:porin family protein [Prevotella sp.]MCM1074379.1 porin family protein [Ruminococcus sp.]
MKKVLLAILSLFVAAGAYAQSYLLDNPNNHGYFGIRGSYNLSIPSKVKANVGNSFDTKTKVFGKGSGFTIGAIYNLPLVANLYLEPGVTLAYSTQSFKNTQDMFPAFFDKKMKHSSARRFSFEVPVQVGYHFDFTPDVSLAISTGPVLKVGLVNDYYLTTDNELHQSGSLYGDNGVMRRVDCAWRVGVGFNIATNYYIGVSGDIGMVNMLKDDNDGNVSMHENAFNVSLGYNF